MGLFGSIFAGVVPVFASSASEHYRTGYDDACAGMVVPGPHTTDYQEGYAAGQAACSGGGNNNVPQPLPNNPRSSSSSDWTLTVNINNVNFGESSIGVNIKGPFGYNDYQSVPNGPSPTATFTIPGNAVPAGYSFQVCAGTGIEGAVLPHCQMFLHSQEGDAMVTVTPWQYHLQKRSDNNSNNHGFIFNSFLPYES